MAQEKQVTIVVAGSNGEAKDIALAPGGTVQDALDATGLQGYSLSYKGKPLNPEDDLHALVNNGDKVHASLSEMIVGMGGFASLYKIPDFLRKIRIHIKDFIRNFQQYIKKQQLPEVKRVRLIRTRRIRHPCHVRKVRVTRTYRRKAAKVTRVSKERDYWQGQGWIRKGDEYKGYFRTELGEWRGLIKACPDEFKVFIFKPPRFLKGSSHEACFLYKSNGWYEVHYPNVPTDVSSAILAVEKVIHNAFDEKREGSQK
ncbi:MAG: hypothetical protein NT066_00625 [Candidatus Omnitrophica bacterium]|nr:hypothetical protein [Candidatus Omnitrophota bacterium]